MSEKVDVFEGTRLAFTAQVVKGDPNEAEGKNVKWSFAQLGGQEKIPDTEVPLKDGKAVHAVKAPKVKDNEEHYEIRYQMTYEGSKTSGKRYYIVWPKTFELKAVHKVEGSEKPCENFSFDVRTDKGVADEALTTDPQGEHHYTCRKMAPHTVVARSPWEVESWKQLGPRKREALVRRKKYTAELVSPPADGSPHKQLINLVDDGTQPRHGSRIKVKICAKGDLKRDAKDRLGFENDEIFIQVIFSAKNSKRDDPKPRLIVDGSDVAPEADKRTFKSKLKLKAKGEPAECEVELGRAGGDECEIKVGVTEACTDDSAKLVNWRRYKLEMWQPEANVVSSYAVFNGAKVGLGSDQEKALNRQLAKCFVEFAFDYANSGFFKDGPDLENAGAWRIYDGAYFGQTKGKKVLVGTIGMLDKIRIAKAGDTGAQAKDSMVTVWTDYFMEKSGAAAVWQNVKMAYDDDASLREPSYFLFRYDPSSAAKTEAVEEISWQAVEYKSWGFWHDITADSDPGGDKRYANAVAAGDFKDWLEFSDCHTIKIKLPDDLKAWMETRKVKIRVFVKLWKFWLECNAAGWHGHILMGTEGGKASQVGIIDTFCHEMGHNLGQVYADQTVGPTYGFAPANEIPKLPFPAGVPGGYAYEGLGHTGLHCAYGISAANRQTAVDNGDISPYFGDAKCVMYGAGDMKSSKSRTFCDECLKYIVAIDGSDITKDWR
ncbi:MAG: hypothetical protein JXP73_01275 [Deltaproteobacteria bacterium]|nr:hypothetical protein [Deltaproteobacteria bacterium]